MPPSARYFRCLMPYKLPDSLNSVVSHCHWPALPNADSAFMMSMLYQMEKAEQMPLQWVQDQQLRQLQLVVQHAQQTVPLYAGYLPAGLAKAGLDWQSFAEIPILYREQLQLAGEGAKSTKPPQGHKLAGKKTTSGSTGMPVTTWSSNVSRAIWLVNTVRAYLWQDWDFSATLASIRPESSAPPGQGTRAASWGRASSSLTRTGPGIGMNVRTPIEQQLHWLNSERPDYLLSLPTNLRALVEAGADLTQLRGVQAYGEILDDDTRAIIERGAPWQVFDGYSSQEVGYITLQCAEEHKHHILSDSILMEILDDSGRPCRPGETGRVVVTTLHNLVAPLIRYAIGDYAVAGESCSCGRQFPVADKILGRSRNMVQLPNGSTHWPSFPLHSWSAGIPIKQFQIRQTSIDTLQVQLVAQSTIGPVQEEQMRTLLRERFSYPFNISFSYAENIPRSRGGKYEDFVSLVKATGQ
jgi:phenylacetate-CoA ligase